MTGTILEWLHSLWDTLDAAGPVANLFTIGTTTIVVATGMLARFRGTLRHKDTEIANLKKDVAHREQTSQKNAARAEMLEKRCSEIEGRLAETALENAERERQDNNFDKAQYELLLWLEREGRPIARLLVCQAEWATARAVGELRAAGLAVAEGFSQSALIFDPANKDAVEFAKDLAALRDAEGQPSPVFVAALMSLRDSDPGRRFHADEVIQALATQREARVLSDRGYYHLAMPLIDRAVGMLRQQLGEAARQTISARQDKVLLLIRRGHPEIAVAEARSIVAAAAALGSERPETLVSRYFLARALYYLGETDEALLIIRQVVAAQEANPALGPEHPDTLASRLALAETIYHLGKAGEALPIIRQVVAAQEANPALGPEHPDTLAGRYLLAQMLYRLGEAEQALPIIQQVVAARKANPALGPEHPDTLASQCWLADVLDRLGKAEEALPIIRQAVTAYEANPALGPEHPDTLGSRYMLTRVLCHLGKAEEALPIIRQVVTAQEGNPALGPEHPHTRASRHRLADVLDYLGKAEEALPIIRQVVTAREATPTFGPKHPETLMSRYLLARVLYHLGKAEEALPIIQQVVAAQEANPALGLEHPDTLSGRYLLAALLDPINGSDQA